MNSVLQFLRIARQCGYSFLSILLIIGIQELQQTTALEAIQVSQIARIEEEKQFFCQDQLPTKIEAILSEETLQRSRLGILVKSLKDGETLYNLASQKYFIPASNAKLLVTAAALIKFGSNFQIETPIYGQGYAPRLNRLKIVGNGDPTLRSEQLQQIAKDLKNQGIQQIDNLIIQDGRINITPINPTWEWEDIQFYYGTAVNNLILNENSVSLKLIPQNVDEPLQLEWSDSIAGQQWKISNQTITAPENTPYSISIERNFGQPLLMLTGQLAIDSQPDTFGLAVVNPENYFRDFFKTTLEKEGIKVINTQIIDQAKNDNKLRKLISIKSQPLKQIIKKANEESNNLYAESLLNLLGNTENRISNLDILKETLNEIGLDPQGYKLKDGSGLSRHNLITPETLVNLLSLMINTPQGNDYRNSLAISGMNGTLKNRFKNTILEGKIQAKTGTLSGNSALSGYLDPPNYSPLVFSIMINQSNLSSSELRDYIDNILLTLGYLKQC